MDARGIFEATTPDGNERLGRNDTTSWTVVHPNTASYRPGRGRTSGSGPTIDILLLKGTSSVTQNGRLVSRPLHRRASAISINNTTNDRSASEEPATHQAGYISELCSCRDAADCACAQAKYGSGLTISSTVPSDEYWCIFRLDGVNFIYLTPQCQCGSRMIFVRNESIWQQVRDRVHNLRLGNRPDIVCPNPRCSLSGTRQIHCMYWNNDQQRWIQLEMFRPINAIRQLGLAVPDLQIGLLQAGHTSAYRNARQRSLSDHRRAAAAAETKV